MLVFKAQIFWINHKLIKSLWWVGGGGRGIINIYEFVKIPKQNDPSGHGIKS